MGEFEYDDSGVAPLGAMVHGARQFGLTDGEVLETFDECVYEVGTDASVAELLDELTGALARSILGKQRRGAVSEERRARSKDPR